MVHKSHSSLVHLWECVTHMNVISYMRHSGEKGCKFLFYSHSLLQRIINTFGQLGERNGNPLQFSCLENSMDKGVGLTSVHGLQRVRHD